MKKRIAIVTAALGLLTLGGTAAAQALPTQTESTWGCAGSEQLNLGVCVHDPIPHPLPTVSLPAPALP